jgi:hypothetical protein
VLSSPKAEAIEIIIVETKPAIRVMSRIITCSRRRFPTAVGTTGALTFAPIVFPPGSFGGRRLRFVALLDIFSKLSCDHQRDAEFAGIRSAPIVPVAMVRGFRKVPTGRTLLDRPHAERIEVFDVCKHDCSS